MRTVGNRRLDPYQDSEVEMKTVLVVEDDKKITLALSMRLKASGYEVVAAADAVYAMQTARKSRPDAVLLDINLPGGDGFLVADRLRRSLETATVPIIFITASKRDDLRARATELGAAGFLEKPFEASALIAMLERSIADEPPAHGA